MLMLFTVLFDVHGMSLEEWAVVKIFEKLSNVDAISENAIISYAEHALISRKTGTESTVRKYSNPPLCVASMSVSA